MNIENCPKCGRLFGRISDPICEECLAKEEELFKKACEYIDENPYATVAQISKDVGISVKIIMRYLREGRLEVTQGLGGVLRCSKCNKPILRGNYCDACVIEFNQVVTEIFDVKNKHDKAKMHTATEHKRYERNDK